MNRHATIILLGAAALAACSKKIDSDSPPATLEVASAQAAPAGPPVAPVTAAASSTSFKTVLYSEHDAEVTARTAGVVRSTLVDLGDAVAEGAVLAILSDEREAAALESAAAALDLARSERARAASLREGDMVTQAQLDAAVYKEKAADAAVRDATVRMDYTRIRAPFAGRISQRFVRVGQTVREADPLFRVTATRPLRASLRLPELQARQLPIGANVTLRSLDGDVVYGRVARIAPTVDAASGTVELLVDVPQPRSLTPGSTVTVEIAGPAPRKAAQ